MSLPLLLDTCVVIWIGERNLPEEARQEMEKRDRRGEPILISPITAWELGLLASRGRLHLPVGPADVFQQALRIPGASLAPLTPQILLGSSYLPGMPPRDPADRILAATARALGYTLMTRDRRLLTYAAEGFLRAVAC